MARVKLPLSVLVALGLVSCGTCRPGVCLSIIADPDQDQEGGEEMRPCLSVLPPEEPEDEFVIDDPMDVCLSVEAEPELEPPPPPRAGPCLSAPYRPSPPDPHDAPPIPEVEQPPEADPPRPCLSIRRPDPPPPPDPEVDPETLQICLSEDVELDGDDDGGASVDPTPGEDRLAVLERLGDALPPDVRERL